MAALVPLLRTNRFSVGLFEAESLSSESGLGTGRPLPTFLDEAVGSTVATGAALPLPVLFSGNVGPPSLCEGPASLDLSGVFSSAFGATGFLLGLTSFSSFFSFLVTLLVFSSVSSGGGEGVGPITSLSLSLEYTICRCGLPNRRRENVVSLSSSSSSICETPKKR